MTSSPTIRTLGGCTPTEAERKRNLAQLLRKSRVPDQELLDNPGLHLTHPTLSRINFMQKLYAMILPYLTKGSVLAFDELNTPELPGETIALREVLGLSRHTIKRDPANPLTSYLVID